RRALAIAEDAGELDDAALACRNELLAGKLGRGPQITALAAARMSKLGRECLEMDLVARRHLQRRCLDLDERVRGKVGAQRGHDLAAREEDVPALGMALRRQQRGAGHREVIPVSVMMATLSASPRKSGLPDLRRVLVRNSGKPELRCHPRL